MSHHQANTQNRTEIKIVLVGSVGVGKTSTVLRFIKDNFKEYLETTIGASYMSRNMTIDDVVLQYSVWDTAGQEKFHSLVPLYFRKATAVLVVYDLSRQKTFEDAKQWVKSLRNHAPENAIIALAGNKLDLANLRDVETEEAQQYANEIGAIFRETSAKDSTGIVQIFEEIGRTYLNRLDASRRANMSTTTTTNNGNNGNVGGNRGSGGNGDVTTLRDHSGQPATTSGSRRICCEF